MFELVLLKVRDRSEVVRAAALKLLEKLNDAESVRTGPHTGPPLLTLAGSWGVRVLARHSGGHPIVAEAFAKLVQTIPACGAVDTLKQLRTSDQPQVFRELMERHTDELFTSMFGTSSEVGLDEEDEQGGAMEVP